MTYKKNTAGQFFCFQGVDTATGGVKSGVSWTVRRCIDGTFANATGSATEDGSTGWYKFAMSQADTNGNNIGFNFTGTGAVPQTVNIITDGAPSDINLTQIDGQATSGNNATLYLKSLDIVNSSGIGMKVYGSNVALDVQGTASYAMGIQIIGGDGATAVSIEGGGAIDGDIGGGVGLALNGGAGGDGPAYELAGPGLYITAGTNNGAGGNHAMDLNGTGTGKSINAPDEIAVSDGNLTLANINAQVVDALNTDTYAEPTGAPGATVSLAEKIGRNYQALRNKLTVTSGSKAFFDDAGGALWSKTLSDNGTTYTEEKGA